MIVFGITGLNVLAEVITPVDVFMVEGEQRYVAREEASNFKETMSRAGKKITEVEVYDVEGEKRLLISVERRDDFLKAVRERGLRFERRIVFAENGKIKDIRESELRGSLELSKDMGEPANSGLFIRSGIEGFLAATLLVTAMLFLKGRSKRREKNKDRTGF